MLTTCKQRPQSRCFKIHCSCLRIFAYTHDTRVVSESCERVATVPCACVHLCDCFSVEGHIFGSLSNDDGNVNENVTWKYIFNSFVLLRDYFNSLNFYKNGELSRNQIGRSGEQFKKENEKFTVVRSRSPKNLKCGHFTLLFCRRR